MSETPGRSWGYWTRAKLEMLADYLAGFATASKGQAERVYLDAFAGEGSGLDRLTGEEFPGSARIALEAGESAGFTRFRYFEKRQRAGDLEAQLQRDYPDRDIKVYEGDCNTTIPDALAELKALNWAPTFAFVDPDGMEVAWDTLRGKRSGGRPA
ncbi:MAG TPA: three-Cys-motif partner protein TcmP [Solirubrobacterales bacterium]|nr:three-Cys-motif partner protein TcmP [Solirubrobacterales bacterium]